MQGEVVKIGSAVKVVDETGVLHNGLVTNWASESGPSTYINVVYLSVDPKAQDQYGRQKEHLSSCSHRDVTGDCPGRYWFVEGDVKPETIAYYGAKVA